MRTSATVVGTAEVVAVGVIGSWPRLVKGRTNVPWVGLHEPTGLSIGQIKLCSKEDLDALSSLLESRLQPHGRGGGGP